MSSAVWKPTGDPPVPLTPSASRLRRLHAEFVWPHRWAILFALAGMFLGPLALLPVSLVQGWVLDRLVEHVSPPSAEAGVAASDPSRCILLALGVTVACYLVRLALVWRSSAVMNRVSLEVARDLTDALHRKFQRLPLSYFDREQTGPLMARITSDVGSLMIFLGTGSLQLVSDLMLAVGIAAILLWLNWQLALVCFVVVPLYAVNHQLFAGRIHALSGHVRAQVGAVYALLSERISAVRVVRSFSQEEAELRRLETRIDAHRDLSRASLWVGAWQTALAAVISGAGTVAVLVAGVVFVRTGQLSVGGLLAFSALVTQLYNPIVRLIQFQAGVSATRVAVDRMIEVFDEPESLADRADARPLESPRGRLVFENVTFRYRPEGRPVLEGINLTVEAGMTVGILGPSGSGKSTLLALAPRLYDVTRGSILFDGRDVRTLRRADLRRTVALVPQQAVLFEGTLRSNLLYAAPGQSESALHRVLEAMDLDELVKSLPQGLETPVGERGYSLSGGQRQRLALARALLAEPAVLLLDDCTSALDAETEARVRARLDDLLPGRTRLIVSPRLASVREADWVIVLESGRIVEQGSPEDLLRHGGIFSEAQHLPTIPTPL
jgi:ABC-type multidrug transport system fused ATPase/permease subunit